jgi:hypothetical protein
VSAATVGAFEGAGYYHSAIYRGQYNCRMRALGNPFCEVCKQVIQRAFNLTYPPDLTPHQGSA